MLSDSKPELIATFEPDGVAELDLYQKREKVYTRKIKGFYQRLRLLTGWPLLLGYFLLPWLSWNNQPAVLFDLPARKFTIFSVTYWPQDFPILAGFLIIAAIALFTVTNWLGRVWCGYTCPQTVWTAVFMWAEQLCEGSRNQRIKRDRAPLNFDTFWRKLIKHIMWVGFSFLTGLTFIGYFYPIQNLSLEFLFFFISPLDSQLGLSQALGVLFFTGATYVNAGWLREQVCMYMCPYARFQSAMFDDDTLVVSYDAKRGESRGARKRGAGGKTDEHGDCIDCQICVQVCPTDIDIRDGLQYQCINCALCIDACNSVMKKMDYPLDLIRYTTQNALQEKPSKILRPSLIAYLSVLTLATSVLLAAVSFRSTVELDVKKGRQALYLKTADGLIENIYTLKIINKEQDEHTFSIAVSGLENATLIGNKRVEMAAGEIKEIPLRLQIHPSDLSGLNTKIVFNLESIDNPELSSQSESRFIGPLSLSVQ